MRKTKTEGFFWLTFFFTCLFGGRMYDFDLRGDSMNYAAISNNILYSNDPLILTLNGELYMNKPPLFFWVNALFIKLFGANPFSVRLSTLIAVIVIIWFLYKIAMELFEDSDTALMMPLLFFATYIVYKNTHMLKLEAFVSAFVAGSLYFFIRYLREKDVRSIVFTAVFAGLAVFSKGPLGLIVLLASIIFPLVSKEHRTIKYFKHILLALGITLLIPGWWYGYVMAKTPFFDTFFLEQMFDRLGGNSLNFTEATYKVRPLWQYLLYIGKYGGLFLILFPLGLYKLITQERFTSGLRFMFTLSVLYFVIIHFITTKEHRYLYQFYMFTSFISAYGLTSVLSKGFVPFVKWLGVIFALFIALYPGTLDWDSYDSIKRAKEMSEKSGLPVVARDDFIRDISDKAAMSFYLRDHLKEPPQSGGWLEVVEKRFKVENGHELYRSKRVSVYIVNTE
ncbi:MAG: hypothetical protein C0602_10000 [Denitrovibrio sp.]|nr:MAG: hypothetical protein C0602_10000 [Denitrovibrio sp.]